MFKTLFITLNLAGLMLVPMLYTADVSIEHDGPKETTPGSTVEYTITIHKGDVTGPGRLKLNLEGAPGMTGEEVSNDGASLTNNDNELLYIWYSIPGKETLTIKYRLKASSDASGEQVITGQFSYLDNDDRKKIEVPQITISVSGDAQVASTTETAEGNQVPEVLCSRTITPIDDGFKVEINVKKGDAKGFARIKEIIPDGFTAENIEGEAAIFKFVNNTVKYLWTALPNNKEEINVAYRLVPFPTASGQYSINGAFSGEFLIIDDKPNNIDIPTTTFDVNDASVIASNVEDNSDTPDSSDSSDSSDNSDSSINDSESNDTSDNADSSNPEDIADNSDSTEDSATSESDTHEDTANNNEDQSTSSNIEENAGTNTNADTSDSEDTASNTETEDNSSSDTESTTEDHSSTTADASEDVTTIATGVSNSGVSFRVQLLAAHRVVDKSYIKRNYNGYTGGVNLENHQGWVKYTTDNVNEYKQARDKRNALKKYDFPGPFVTAYNESERITVQEALMITNQKWVQ